MFVNCRSFVAWCTHQVLVSALGRCLLASSVGDSSVDDSSAAPVLVVSDPMSSVLLSTKAKATHIERLQVIKDPTVILPRRVGASWLLTRPFVNSTEKHRASFV